MYKLCTTLSWQHSFNRKETQIWSHFLDTADDVVYQDIPALDLTCVGGYLGGAESKPGVGELPI